MKTLKAKASVFLIGFAFYMFLVGLMTLVGCAESGYFDPIVFVMPHAVVVMVVTIVATIVHEVK